MSRLLASITRSKLNLFLTLVFVIGAFLRLYNLPASTLFLADQGRDAMIVSNIFKNNDLVFIGPVTSVGNMYLGPLYYYFMLPFLWLSYPSPLGPVYAVALLGVITMVLMYVLGRELVGTRAAAIAAVFYAFSATTIIYTRYSWNPNPEPLVSLLMMWCTYKAWQKNSWYWVGVAVCFSILMQLHYLALLSLAGSGLIWLLQIFELATSKNETKKAKSLQLAMATAASVVVVLLSLTPLALFDYKHDFLNIRALQNLFVKENSFKVGNLSWHQEIAATVRETHGRSLHILFEYALGKFRMLNTVLVVITLAATAFIVSRKNKFWPGQMVLISFLVTGIIGTAFYEHTIFDHYIAYLFPVTFLIYGLVLGYISKFKIGQVIGVLAFIGFLALNTPRIMETTKTTAWGVPEMKATADSILNRLKPEDRYNLVLFSGSGDIYGQNYRYFLSTTNQPALTPEQANQANTLVIINEEHIENPTEVDIFQIKTFPGVLSESYTIPNGPDILILRKSTEQTQRQE